MHQTQVCILRKLNPALLQLKLFLVFNLTRIPLSSQLSRFRFAAFPSYRPTSFAASILSTMHPIHACEQNQYMRGGKRGILNTSNNLGGKSDYQISMVSLPLFSTAMPVPLKSEMEQISAKSDQGPTDFPLAKRAERHFQTVILLKIIIVSVYYQAYPVVTGSDLFGGLNPKSPLLRTDPLTRRCHKSLISHTPC